MKRKITSLTTAIIVLCVMLICLPRTVWATQDQVTSQTATNNGQYVIAIYYNGDYYALPKASDITSSGTHSGVKVTLNAAGKVSTSDAADITWKLVVNSNNSDQFYIQQTIGNKTYYLYKNGTSGNTNYNISAVQSGQHYWTFSQQSNTYSTYTVKSERGSVNLYLTNTSNTSTFSVRSATNSYITLLAVGDAFNVTYNPGTGSGTPLVDNNGGSGYANNATVTVKANDGDGNPNFSKTGHTFGGWFMNQACTGTEYGPGENQTHTFSITANTTLYAKWIPETYNITYQAGFGEQPDIVETKTYGVNYTIADNAFDAPSGSHTFIGWKDASSNDWVPGDTYTGNAALTLTAQWTTATMYTVSYDCNGGESGCPNNAIIESGTQINLPAAPTYTDHTFNGWMCDVDLETYAAGATYTVTSNVGFEAQWLENLANPTFSITGVSNGTANTYYVTANITIEQEDGADVYYTTDNSDPTILSTKYTAAFSVTESCTIKAIAIENGYANSQIVSQQISIVQPNEATFTSGIYNDLTSGFGDFYTYNVTGNQVWTWTSYSNTQCAYMNGYDNGRKENEDWLISPKLVAENGKLNISFQSLRTYSGGTFTAKYSTNYNGYGAPSTATWNNLDVTMATSTSWTNSGNFTVNGTNIHIAIVYTSTTESAGAYYIKNFTAKQCYPITYYANGGTGTTADANSPYAVGTEVTILDNGFTAPAGKEFTSWNTVEGGTGETKSPGQKITMTTAGYELYAQWGDACVLKAEMNATTSGGAVYDYNGGEKRFNITPSSSVKTLGGCDIYEYGFVYSTTEENPTIEDTKVVVGETQPAVATAFNTTITNVTKSATYYIRSYATNAAGTAYSDVISVTVPADFPTWTISYTTNGEAEATTTSIYKGAPISGLLAAPEQNVPAGYNFMGWYGSDYALNNEAPTFVKNGDAINSNLTLKAVFAIQAGGGSANTYSLVEDDDDLNDGDIVVLYSSGSYKVSGVTYTFSKANGGISDGLFSDEDVEVDNDQFTSTDVVPMTLVKTNSKWKLQIGNQFVGAVNKGVSLNNTGSENSISITEGEATITASISSTDYNLQYNPNSGNGRFAYYSSTQKPISLYKQNTPTYSSYCTSVSPQTAISGTITAGHLTTDGTIAAGTAVYLTSPITINSGVKLTVNGALGNDNPANLIIEDGGQLILKSTNAGVQATFKKNIEDATARDIAGHWYTISTPTGGIDVDDVVNLVDNEGHTLQYNLFRYKESTHMWEAYNTTNHADFTTLEKGRGYLYRNNGKNLEFPGEVNVGDVTVHLTNTEASAALRGFNLIGNPYGHNIYKGAGAAIADAKLNDGFYYLTNEGGWHAGTYSTAITPKMGILVQLNNSYEELDLTITDKTAEATAEKYANDNLMFTVSNNDYEDVTYAMFHKGYGLTKINHRNADIPMVYINQDNEDYAIAMLSDDTKAFNLCFKAKTTGQYKLTYKAEGEFSYLHVIDRLTGNDVDMLLEGEYSFIGTPHDNENRFIVSLGYLPDYGEDNNDIFAFQNGSDILVSGQGELQIFDVTGRMVKNMNINGAETINVQTQGVYILRLVGTEVKTQKIVVK